MNIICALTNLTAVINFQGLSIGFIPKNRDLCPPINQDTEVVFKLYTRQNLHDSQRLKLNDDVLLERSFMDFKKKTIIFYHGFLESSESHISQLMKDDYLKMSDVNIILVDMSLLLSGIDYISCVSNIKPIANLSAQFVDYLTTKGLKLKDLHLFGMSLGAHIAGVTGSLVKTGQVERVTGLDPAGPFFYFKQPTDILTKNDAKYVDVVHSNAGGFGIIKKCGRADFWLNGGTRQPACSFFSIFKAHGFRVPEYIFCSHMRAYKVYAESILNTTKFMAYKCKRGVRRFNKRSCDTRHPTPMGAYVSHSTEGNYAVKTPSDAPYY